MIRRSTFRVVAVLVMAASALVLTPAARAERPPVERPYYLALGDSFTAAPLSSRPVGEFGDDTRGPLDCGKSDRNYPHLVAEHLGLFDPNAPGAVATPEHSHEVHPGFIDISCGGADTGDMTKAQEAAFGWHNPAQLEAFDWVPDDATVTLVTVGVGGNDIGFGELLDKCVQEQMETGTPCRRHYEQDEDGDGLDVIGERLEALRTDLTAVVQGIRDRAPRAEILLWGYPALFPEEPLVPGLPEGCYPYIPILPEDVPYLRDAEKALNLLIHDVAEENGAHYVDWYTPSIGHDACQPPGLAWVNGIVIVPPSFPAHPNVLGSIGAAEAGVGVLDDICFDLSRGRIPDPACRSPRPDR